jgi:lysophospholipase L1-like esterase
MGGMSRAVTAMPVVPVAAGAFVLGQVVRATRRADLPSFPNQDPSGMFGDPSAPRVRIVSLGDSSVTAPGVEDLSNVWIRRIARRLADHHRVELVSVAVGGARSRDVIEGQLDEAVRLLPTVATVSVGANDALRGVGLGAYRRRLTTIVDRLAATGAGVMVWGMGDLSSIPRLPWSIRRYVSARSRRFDAVARDVALANPRAVKVYTQGRASRAFFEDPSLFAADLFHANDAGHVVFAEEALPAFEAALAIGLGRGVSSPEGR